MVAEKLNMLPVVRGEYKFDEPLKRYTWLNVGGAADVMFLPQDVEDLQYFLQNKPVNLDVFVLGGGANLLVRDGGIGGVVVKLADKNFATVSLEKDKVICGAGLLNNVLRKSVIEHGLGGLEFLCSIPGCVGGALRSNAGCFGREFADVLLWAKVIDNKGNIFKVAASDFNFSYRHSDFPKDWIVVEVAIQYEQRNSDEVAAVVQEQAEYRRNHQPHGIRTAGSTFKNPPQMRAWELIKNSGADKLVVGGAKMSSQHCNFLFNDGSATAADIEQLCDKIIELVEADCGVRLELEIQKVGRK